MSDVEFKKHRVFRETQDVIFYDISVEDSNASDLVVHEGSAVFIIIRSIIIVLLEVKEPLS